MMLHFIIWYLIVIYVLCTCQEMEVSLLLSIYTEESLSCNMLGSTSLEWKLREERMNTRRGDGATCACMTTMGKSMGEFM